MAINDGDKTARMLAQLASWVQMESPSSDKQAADRLVDEVQHTLQECAQRWGGQLSRIPRRAVGDTLSYVYGPKADRPVLLLAHLDTVHPLGSLTQAPWRVQDGRAFGPGVFDDKAGLVMAMEAVEQVVVTVVEMAPPIQLLITADEEIGSGENRALIEASAQQARAVLVMEGAAEGGALKWGRRGVGRAHLHVDGIAAHAGNDAAHGVSAIHQLAQLICEVVALAAPERGTLINVGRISGGTAVNTIAAQADAWVDLRLATTEEAERVMEALHRLKPSDPHARLTVEGGVNRPAWQPSSRDRQLFEHAQAIAAARGERLQAVAVGGGSDGNFTAPFAPTLDGLGACGGAAHTLDEWIEIASLTRRAELLADLIVALGKEEARSSHSSGEAAREVAN